MEKVDFKKQLKALYGPTRSRGLHVVEVPTIRFLMIDGHGDPNAARSYREAVETLFAVAYTLKFASKTQLGRDYTVPPLEGLWWAKDLRSFAARDKDKWHWTMMIMVPDWIGPAMIAAAIETARAKKGPAALDLLRVEALEEGRAVQVLHIGPYDDEGPILARMHEHYIPDNGWVPTGRHHEIYLGDPRKSAPEKLRTILRQPVKERPGISPGLVA
ncbi:GyrI-like domain-containing protein [Pelagibacterium nitratireducens]|uniref:GyrI-like domain-containing protein n=1 Tax=Pelagibacterium nitratireducens TaxID=1046114 RepID=A0ABZ2I4Y4_9HYPH